MKKSISESRINTYGPEDIKGIAFKDSNDAQELDRTHLDLNDQIREIAELVINNDNIFVSFADKYDRNVPRLEVNPNITYDTPHGIYGYPLDKSNIYEFLVTGKPTGASFAVDRKFYHIYKIDDLNKIKIEKNGDNNYDNRRYFNDAQELTRNFLYYLVSYMSGPFGKKLITKLEKQYFFHRKKYEDLYEVYFVIHKDEHDHENVISFITQLFYNDYINIHARINDNIIRDILTYFNIKSTSNDNIFRRQAQSSMFYRIIYLARTYSDIISRFENSLLGKSSGGLSPAGGMFSVLLSNIGINVIDDSKGTGTLHHNEPSQAVSIDTSNNARHKLLGTYKNPGKISQSVVDKVLDEKLISGDISAEDYYNLEEIKYITAYKILNKINKHYFDEFFDFLKTSLPENILSNYEELFKNVANNSVDMFIEIFEESSKSQYDNDIVFELYEYTETDTLESLLEFLKFKRKYIINFILETFTQLDKKDFVDIDTRCDMYIKSKLEKFYM